MFRIQRLKNSKSTSGFVTRVFFTPEDGEEEDIQAVAADVRLSVNGCYLTLILVDNLLLDLQFDDSEVGGAPQA